jgi:type II secretory ATPase GspE/PulE/Tfp pilus assembly ATPase PilB-like protein
MPEKIIKTLCRYARAHGHAHLRLEKKGDHLLCVCGLGQTSEYLHLDRKTEHNITETFRRLVGAADNDLFSDKRFKIADNKQPISGRATLLPYDQGEKLFITLSTEKPALRRLSALGLNREQQALIKTNLKKKSGLIIIAGGPEEGASSTYYSLLSIIASSGDRSIYSLEDYPVLENKGVNTINLRKYSDPKTAIEKVNHLDSEVIGIDAALQVDDIKALWQSARSGRLIIATLPVASAALAVKLLRQSGLSAADIASQIIFISAQKLFKRPCPRCLHIFDPGLEIKKKINKRWPAANLCWPKKLFYNRGCSLCQKTNRESKTAVFEIMRFWPDGRLQDGYEAMIKDALDKTGLGLINIEEIANWAMQTTKKI